MNFEWSLLAAPLCAGLLVCATHIPLGRRVLERGIIFLDLTVAQVAALGVTLEDLWHPGHGSHPDWHAQIAATGGALLAAMLLAWTEKRWPQVQEALIGSLYVLTACITMLVLAGTAHGHEQLSHLLAGQILWMTFDELLLPLIITLAILAAMALGLARNIWGFYLLFAVSVTVSVQMVGVFLVFATLILPALTFIALRPPLALWLALGLGAGGYALGLFGSALFDLPSGPLVVVALTAVSLVAACATRLFTNPIND
ncbi:MAG: metal ABC transporter permease [Nevskiales bacterium]